MHDQVDNGVLLWVHTEATCCVLGCGVLSPGSSNTRLQGASDELAGQKALFKDTHKQQRTLLKQSWMDR
jgi:hypothetical protein